MRPDGGLIRLVSSLGDIRGVRPGKFHFLGLLVLGAILATGCANGTYPLDIFYEMHYHQSFHAGEPPRLTVPEGAVPITGVQMVTGVNPFPESQIADGAALFATNCTMCHGLKGEGNGPVLETMRARYNPLFNPALSPDLTSDAPAHAQSGPPAGVLSWIVAGSGFIMPSFQKLLSVDEQWLLVNFIRGCYGQERQTDCPDWSQ